MIAAPPLIPNPFHKEVLKELAAGKTLVPSYAPGHYQLGELFVTDVCFKQIVAAGWVEHSKKNGKETYTISKYGKQVYEKHKEKN